MLGFSSISETPISQAVTSLAALGYLLLQRLRFLQVPYPIKLLRSTTLADTTTSFTINAFGDVDAQATIDVIGVLSNFSIGDLTDVRCTGYYITPSAATATFVAANFADVDAKALTNLGSVSATGQVDVDFDAQASITTSSVTSSFDTSEPSLVAKANTTPSGATATVTNTAFADVDAQASTNIVSVSFSVDVTEVDTDAQASASPTGVTSTFSEGTLDFIALANITPTGAIGTFVAAPLNYDADASVRHLTGATATVTANSFADVDAQASASLSSAYMSLSIADFEDVDAQATIEVSTTRATGIVNPVTASGVRFDFEQYANSYDRSRTVYILGYGDSKTTYVKSENRTVYITQTDTNRTVHINPENYSVVIDRDPRDRTVYILRG